MTIQTSFLNSIRYNKSQSLGITFQLPLEYGISLGQVVSDLLSEIADPACCDVHHSERPSLTDLGLFLTLTQLKGTTVTLLKAPWHTESDQLNIKTTVTLLLLHGLESFLKTFKVDKEDIFPLQVTFNETIPFSLDWINRVDEINKYISRSKNSKVISHLVQ